MTQPNEEQWNRLCDTAKKLIEAPPAVVAESHENFLAMIKAALDGLEATKPRVGRGTLIVELGLRRADIVDHPERYQANSAHVAPSRSPCKEGVKNMGSGGERSTGGIEVGRKPSTSRASSRHDPPRPAPVNNEPDEDDQPW